MLITINNTRPPATDLGYLLHKNPDRVQSFDLSFGKAHVFYPEATNESCTAALLLDVDPVALVRTRRGPSGEGGALDPEVKAASIAKAVCLFCRFGPFDLRICQSGHARSSPLKKIPPLQNKNTPKSTPVKRGCTWMHLDAERRKA